MGEEVTNCGLSDIIEALKLTRKFAIFIGAGVSKSAGIPLASEITKSLGAKLRDNDSKQENIDNIESWLEKQPFYDPENLYASMLDASFPNRSKRAEYFETLIDGKSPSKAHLAIANLMQRNQISSVLTTNFDRLMEYAVVHVCQQMPVVLLFDEIPEYVDMKSLRPKIFKLHGDYLYGNIRNLTYELYLVKKSISQKIEMSVTEGPLIVVGYSGGDDSVMDVFDKLAENLCMYPGGIYWLKMRGSKLGKRVIKLLDMTRDRGSCVVEIDDSDTFFTKLTEELPFSPKSDFPCLTPNAHIIQIHEENKRIFIRERLDEVSSQEFISLLNKKPIVNSFADSPAALDYLIARYEENGEIPGNLGEIVDRYIDLLAGGFYRGSCIHDSQTNSELQMSKRVHKIIDLDLLDSIENHTEISNLVLRDYIEAIRMCENGLDNKQIGTMLKDDRAYRSLCLYVGLIEDATPVIKDAIHQAVDVWVLYGRIHPFPKGFYKAASLCGYTSKVDGSLTERIANMLLLEFDAEQWHPQEAISALANMGNNIIEQLIQYMLDPLQETFSREDAALALGRIGTRKIVDKLSDVSYDLDPRDVKMIVYALGLTGNPRAIDKLRNLATNVAKTSEWVLRDALNRLGYDGSDITARASNEAPPIRPDLDAQSILRKYLPNIGDRRDSEIMQGMFRLHPTVFLQTRKSRDWPPEVWELTKVGTALLSQNKPWEAEIIFVECLERYPMAHFCYHNLALAYSRQGRPLAARRYYELGLSLEPDYSDYYNDFAVTMKKLNNLAAARWLLMKTISIDFDNYRPWLNLASVNIDESGLYKDNKDNEWNITLHNNPGIYMKNAQFNHQTDIIDDSRLLDAFVCLQRVLELNPGHPTAKDSLESLCLFVGKQADRNPTPNELFTALHVGETIIPKAIYIGDLPEDARNAYNRSVGLYRQGDIEGALKALDDVRRLYSKSSPDIENNISLLLASLGRIDDAVQNSKEALKKWPNDFHLLLNYSHFLVDAGRPNDAVKISEKAIKVAPTDGVSWYSLAEALYACGNVQEAINACSEAIRFSTSWSWLDARVRDLLQKIEDTEMRSKAKDDRNIFERIFGKPIKLPEEPTVIESWKRKFDSEIQRARSPIKDRENFNKMWVAAQNALFQLDTQKAIELAEEAIKMEPMRAVPWVIKAQALMLDGQLPKAFDAIDRAIEIDPSDPDKWDLKATFLRMIGRMEEAQNCSDKARDLRSH